MTELHPILMLLGKPGERANDIASALCALIKQDRETGAMVRVAVTGIDGQPRRVLVPPKEWLDRLATAADAGVFERRTPKAIAEHILTTEIEAAA